MSHLPPRRWFQFKLTTWFVLIAIFSWAMVKWPTFDWGSNSAKDSGPPGRVGVLVQSDYSPGARIKDEQATPADIEKYEQAAASALRD